MENTILHTIARVSIRAINRMETFSRGLITFQKGNLGTVNGSIDKLLICVKCPGTFRTRPVRSQCNSNPAYNVLCPYERAKEGY